MAEYQILHPSPKSPIYCTATTLVSFKSLKNANSDAVARFEKFRLNQNLRNFKNGQIRPHIIPTSFYQRLLLLGTDFNLIPNAVQVLNLVQSSLQVFLGLLILNFEFFLTFWTCQNSKITLLIGFHSELRCLLLA